VTPAEYSSRIRTEARTWLARVARGSVVVAHAGKFAALAANLCQDKCIKLEHSNFRSATYVITDFGRAVLTVDAP
jgi:hypothetical protein